VGYSYTLPGLKRTFLYRKGPPIDLGARVSPTGYNGLALAMNVKGQVVGVSFPVNSPAFTGVGFVYSGGRGVETFMAPGCSYTEATGINSFGQIVGHGYVTLGPTGPAVQQRAFLRQPNGAITNLDIFGSTWAAANAVNDWGQVVGFYLDSHGANHGFLTQPGGAAPKDLGTFLVRGEPLAVNDLGQVVGYTTVIGESGLYYSQAFLYAQGKMHDLGTSSGYSSSIA
jgi:probable HAF family extracellular repeat protein